ncbi:MAG: hypothetical protein K0R52_460 [Alphaproteobacteria bacterium]|nr:hypothetical protein [Alphaproteobacteria bacterium]
MKNQTMTLMLSLAVLNGGLAAHGMEDDSFKVGPHARQLAAAQQRGSSLASEDNEKFWARWGSLEEGDEKVQRELETLLTQQETQQGLNNDVMEMVIQESLDAAAKAAISPIESLVPHLDEGDTGKGMDILEDGALNMAIELSLRLSPPELEGLKAEASLLKSPNNIVERDTRKESDAAADRIIAEFAEAQEKGKQREEKKKSLVTSINKAHVQVMVLREEEKKAGAMALEAAGKYTRIDFGLDEDYVIVDSAALEGSHEERVKKAKEAWDALDEQHKLTLSKLRVAINERNSLLDQYLDLGAEVGPATRIREVRSQIIRLEQEVKEKKSRALDASGETYGELEQPGAPDEERKHGQETPADLRAEAARAQFALEAAINEEIALIAEYFNNLNLVQEQ